MDLDRKERLNNIPSGQENQQFEGQEYNPGQEFAMDDFENIEDTVDDSSFGGEQYAEQDVPQQQSQAQQIQQSSKSDNLVKIEKILEQEMDYIYEALPQHLQKDFKDKGEKAAREIEKELTKKKINLRKIVKLIVGWLKIIPGINKFFLEQEAKIKADTIIHEFEQK